MSTVAVPLCSAPTSRVAVARCRASASRAGPGGAAPAPAPAVAGSAARGAGLRAGARGSARLHSSSRAFALGSPGAHVPGLASASSRASSVLLRAASAGDAPRSQVATSVFNVATEKLPGGDKLSNEGILAFVLAGVLAVWLGGTFIKTFAVMIGFLFTAAKYFAMGVALVLLGVAAS
jgi:hypothetical protein